MLVTASTQTVPSKLSNSGGLRGESGPQRGWATFVALNNSSPFVVMILALVLGSCLSGCGFRGTTNEEQFQYVFDGYELVGVGDLPNDKALRDITAGDFRAGYPLDAKFVPERLYAFRKTTRTSNETLGVSVLPKRLSAIDAKVTSAPHSSADMMNLIAGGPLFAIEFDKDGHHGRLFNDLNPSAKTHLRAFELLFLAYR